ncbi:PfkB family carbohydrate kinase [Bauldia sp.]|uniref:PfkB family carbohydrate kinase n=1 Tax=Bauldia sp. TaxID=2575872 RepID=UPI003BAC28BD
MRVLVIGNAAVDETLALADWPAPGVSVLASPGGHDLGGKGANQAAMLARCGVRVDLVTAIGSDDAATRIRECLAVDGIATPQLRLCEGPSDRSVILVSRDGENAIVTTTDCADRIDPGDVDRALTADHHALLVQGNLSERVTEHALRKAKARGLKTAFNPSPVRASFSGLLPLVDLLVVNAHEAHALSGVAGSPDAARALLARGAKTAVITLGAEGALSHTEEGVIDVPAKAVTVRDTAGAGDTFAGVLVAGWLERSRVTASELERATSAAAITVGRPGTRSSFPTRDELRALGRPSSGPRSTPDGRPGAPPGEGKKMIDSGPPAKLAP